MQTNEQASNLNQQVSDTQSVDTQPANESLNPLQPVTNKKTPKWLIIGLIALLIGATGVFAYKYYSLKQQFDNQQPTPSAQPTEIPIITPKPTLPPSPITSPTANLKTYSNEKHGFSFNYPQSWQMDDIQGPDDPGVSFSNIADEHTISITVWQVTGFGYCYKYGERKEIIVGGKSAETADGVGGSEMCDKPEEFANRGNTFVLIPIDDANTGLPHNQIHISYDYPLDDVRLAKSNLDQILSTFKFKN
ncbi:MAG: PsbP-related protein [Bacteroidota bacterium]|nr:hypothetical protein [Patescibacteria group bacterium]